MKKLSVFLAAILVMVSLAACKPADLSHRADSENLSISEVMAYNEKFCLGHNLDWVEIYNKGEADIALDGYYLSDDSAELSKFSLSGYVAPAGGYVAVVLPVDASFHLSSDGEIVYLSCGGQLVSQLQFPASQNGESFGVEGALPYPTPGFANTEEGYSAYLATLKAPDLVINEVIASNSKFLPQGGEYFDIVEIKNNSANPINLSEYTLSDKGKEPERYRFPDVVLQPGEFYVVFCSGKTSLGANHASFKISIAQQETVYLSKGGVAVDAITLPADLIENESYGRSASGFDYYSVPTPGKANGEGHQTGVTAPSASVPTGVYAAAQDITLRGKGTIYYTLDGSRPTEASLVYKNPIHIDSQDGAVTIRTFCVDGTRKSALAAYTYVVGVQHDLPVLTVSIPDQKLNGETDGILNHILTTYEYESQVTLIEGGEQKFTIACGFRLHGSGSRKMPKQNFQLRFRSEYGAEKLEYKLFDNRDFDEYDSLLLKGGSEDYNRAVLRDELATTALEGATALYVQAYKPVVLYLGGEYWGVYYIRERFSDDYVASHMNVREESVDLLETNGYPQDGSGEAYRVLKNYVNSHDMSLPENYEYLCSQIDINSLMDWYICRSYMGDKDLANIRCFRSTDGDGKWRWMFFDMDWSFTVTNDRPFSGIISDYNGEPVLMRAALKSAAGKDAFLKRYAYLMSTVLNEQHLNKTLDSIVADIESEMERDRARWNSSVNAWNNSVNRVRNYYSEGKRDQRAKDDLQTYFGLTDEQMKAYFG